MEDRTPEEQLADQEWLTRDARECARTLFTMLTDGQQRAIIDDGSWEWQWLLHSDHSDHPEYPPSWQRRNREGVDAAVRRLRDNPPE